jgi:hypothetical protein
MHYPSKRIQCGLVAERCQVSAHKTVGESREGIHIGGPQAVAFAAEKGVKNLQAALGRGNACGEGKVGMRKEGKSFYDSSKVLAMGRRHRKGRGKNQRCHVKKQA